MNTEQRVEPGKLVELTYKVIDASTSAVLTEVEFPIGYVCTDKNFPYAKGLTLHSFNWSPFSIWGAFARPLCPTRSTIGIN